MTGRESTDRRPPAGSRRASSAIRATTVVLAVVLLLGAVATPVAAHAYLSESDPANGEQVEAVPDDVTLTFSGDGVQIVTDATITGPDGEEVNGEPEIDPDDSQIVRIPIEDAADSEDADGMYTVEWEVIADDGHTTSGTFFFAVGDEPLDRDAVLEAHADDETDESPPPTETASKGLLLVALVGLVGAPLTAAIAVYPAADRFGSSTRAVDRRLSRLLAGGAALLLAAALALGLSRVPDPGPFTLEGLEQFVATPLGQVWLLQLALAVALLAFVAVGGPRRGAIPRRGWLAGTFVGALGVGATVGWTSHSATAIDRLQGMAVDFAHIGGAALWVGGLVVLALIVPPLLRGTAAEDRAALAAATIRRYSLLAVAGVTLAGATGLVLAAWHVPSIDALGETVYGTALSAKTLLVLLALGLGGFTRFVLLRRLEADAGDESASLSDDADALGNAGAQTRQDGGRIASVSDPSPADGTVTRFRRAVRLEVALLVVVLLLSGLLTSVPTAAVAGDDDLGTATIEREGSADLELTVTPADYDEDEEVVYVQEGDPVVFEANLTDDGEQVETDREPRLSVDGPDDSFDDTLERADDGTYTIVQPFADDGDWELELSYEYDSALSSETVDVHVLPDDEHDHGEEDHDHGDNEHDHGDEHADHDDEHADHDVGDETDGAFATLLQFGAVAIGVGGTVAVVTEVVRFRDRSS
ncbi:copper resistance CopC/CopD family protein [Natronolimnohabitans innermongolicus]|uniref:Copper resistance protein CopC n=1 Tax=Natronolimnohabitans innermongolicus JCM 12255 TaxID=1227499 RepID=L9WQM8_9EURY|nr:copper resistance protein CopC [Natronolimnohabitans innermongolicus]ELY51702.1 copper resistance protein CopC [Natronolimnohabitans innermongolicus JCM 12255]